MAALKGAFIKLDADVLGVLPNIIVFQFNPETISRSPSLAFPPVQSDGAGFMNALDQPGEPNESISFGLRLDATDQLARANPIAAANGVLPALSALELLLYPRQALAAALFDEPQPYQNPPQSLPLVLFFWGRHRILPVVVTSMSISETEYDQLLNPVRAEVSVSLEVQTPNRLDEGSSLARGAYRYSQRARQSLAALNLANPPEVIVNTLAAL